MFGQMDNETLRGKVVAHVVVTGKIEVSEPSPVQRDGSTQMAIRLRVLNPIRGAYSGDEFLLADGNGDILCLRSNRGYEVGGEWVMSLFDANEWAHEPFSKQGRVMLSSLCWAQYKVVDGSVSGPLSRGGSSQLTMKLSEFVAAYAQAPQVAVP